MTIFYLDPVNGNDAADGSTFALGGLPTIGPWKTITGGPTAARIAPGDVIRIAKSPEPTSLGQTALFTNLSRDVVLQAGAVTAEIDNCESSNANWTKSGSVSGADEATLYKLGSNSLRLSVAAAFTTGKAAYRDFGAGGVKDLSSYQQISFWIRNFVAIPNAGDVKVKLCSDASGNTPVDTFSIPAIPSTGQWVAITINKGSALGSSIRSVAVYVDTDFGAIDMCFDNIIACKGSSEPDSLTLQSLISKNSAAQGGTEPWYCLQSINAATLKIDNHTNQLGNGGRGYTGATETVAFYKRETVKTALVASGDVQTVQDSGTATAYIEFQGGYNTSSGLQDGETFFDGLNGAGNGIRYDKAYILLNHLWCCRYNNGFPDIFGNCPGVRIWNGGAFSNSVYGWSIGAGPAIQPYNLMFYNNGNFNIISSGELLINTGTIYLYGSMSRGMANYYGNSKLHKVIAKNNNNPGIQLFGGGSIEINDLVSADNGSNAVQIGAKGGHIKVKKADVNEANPVGWDNRSVQTFASFGKWGGVATDHRIFKDMGTIFSETFVVHTEGGLSWKFSPNANANVIVPLYLPVAQVAVNADATVTVKAWLRRSNTGLTLALVCRGGQIAGVESDVAAAMTADADTWQEVTLTFTPTETGVVEIEVQADGGTTYAGYVDDMSFSQAA